MKNIFMVLAPNIFRPTAKSIRKKLTNEMICMRNKLEPCNRWLSTEYTNT
jgi:hypothetical protein